MLDYIEKTDLGYIFYPYEEMSHPGHPRMDVIIREKPTYRHFDPEKATYHVVSATNNVSRLSVHHPWTAATQYRVCAGRIILSDRKAKQIEAFSFGGKLQILSVAEHTVCNLTSSAPIFALYTTQGLPMWITAEVEILLAEQKAHWNPSHPHDFAAHLVDLDPFLLYASCLQALEDRIASYPYINAGELDHQGQHFVQTEIQRLKVKGQWPLRLPTPDQLFC